MTDIENKKVDDQDDDSATGSDKGDSHQGDGEHQDGDGTPSSESTLKNEVEKIQRKGQGRTKLEKAKFARQQIDKQIAELENEAGGEGGESDIITDDKNRPVTVAMLEERDKAKAQQTAITLAEEQVTDPDELTLTLFHLKNTVRPSGNSKEDLKNARAIVNDLKNKQILEEIERSRKPKEKISGSGAPGNKADEQFTPTEEEMKFMKPPFNLSKEKIIQARNQEKKTT